MLIEDVSPQLLASPANALRIALHPQGMAPRTVNLGEWSAHLLGRLDREARITGDPELERLHQELAGYPEVELGPTHGAITGAEIVLPLRLRDGDGELAFFSTLSTFGTAVDMTLAELAIEAFYPANAHAAAAEHRRRPGSGADLTPDPRVDARQARQRRLSGTFWEGIAGGSCLQ
jgi:hypothetical protein